MDWFKSLMPEEEWHARRVAAFVLLHRRAYGMTDPDVKGRLLDSRDTFGWYLFLAEAFIDHVWNYEPMFGSRVVPVLTAVGRNRALSSRSNHASAVPSMAPSSAIRCQTRNHA
ncbi:hypothetical protein GCM10007937_36900 [Mesorhizobium albiziae]|nr:hypothetical protein GCM10007937_36900 [Mesorhizobium albiziae]